MNRLFLILFVAAFTIVMLAKVAAQEADKTPVSVSNAYVPDLSIFPKAKERNKKQLTKLQGPASSHPLGSHPVWLSFAVFDNRWESVADLRVDEVEILIDGQQRKILEMESGPKAVETVFVVDTSPSAAFNIEDIQLFLEAVIARLETDRRITVWKFDAKPQILVEGSSDRVAISKAIRKLKMDSGTSLYDTVDELCTRKSPDSVGPRMVFLISDGVDTTSRATNAAGSLLGTKLCNDIFMPIYLDTYQYHADRVKTPPRIIANIPGLGPVLNAQPIDKEEFDRGRQYLTMLLNMSGGRAFIFPTTKGEIENVAAVVAKSTQAAYSLRVDAGSSNPSMTVQVSVKRPNLNVLSKSVIELEK